MTRVPAGGALLLGQARLVEIGPSPPLRMLALITYEHVPSDSPALARFLAAVYEAPSDEHEAP